MPRLIYPDIDRCRALIIDGNPTSRSILGSMLRQMGVVQIVQTSRVVDARRALENRVFDVVLCDYHFDISDPTSKSGQELLDDLRRSQLLPYATVFIMVTGEASYARVAEAAEAALDSYLLKPHTAAALEQRLLQARHRKTVLRDIFEAIEENDFETAARLCQRRFKSRGEYWLYAARIGAELFLRLGDHPSAKALYEAVQASHALPWAKLGVARAEIEEGQLPQAKRTLESLISEQPSFADAYDVMGRVQVEQGDLGSALETFRNASKITPHSITRLQKQGMLAFYMGATEEAAQALERTVRIGISSKMFDCQSLVLLALLNHDQRDSKGFQRSFDNLRTAAERRPESSRLARFAAIGTLLKALMDRQPARALALSREMATEIRREDFDFEAASNLLSVLSRVRKAEIEIPEVHGWINTIALRYCVSKASSEMLCKTVEGHEPYEAQIRAGQTGIATMAEKAMTHSMTGSPAAAVKALMVKGAETLNAKLIELAGMVLQRHGDKIPDSVSVSEMLGEMKRKYCTKGTQVSLGSSAGRSSGGLTLRTEQAAAAA